jgi:hypothetical protein
MLVLGVEMGGISAESGGSVSYIKFSAGGCFWVAQSSTSIYGNEEWKLLLLIGANAFEM